MVTDAAIVMAAPNGARRTMADHPALPTTAEALGQDAALCFAAGASILHMHVREGDQRHSLDPGLYREAMAAVAEAAPGMIVQATSEAAGRYNPIEQAEAMRALSPEAMSVALREMARDEAAEPHAAEFYAWASDEGAHVQHILYDPAELARLRDLLEKGVIPEGRLALLFVLGKYTPPQEGQPDEVAGFIDAAEGLDASITFCAFGGRELACVAEGMRRGAHARVGFENNLRLPDGRLAARNADLVALAAAEAERLGRGPASPEEARAIFGLRPARQQWQEKGAAQ